MKFRVLLFMMGMILLPILIGAQEGENKIQEAIDGMIEDHPVRLGIFRIKPALDMNAGYDSNAINSAVVEESDTYYRITPTAEAAIKLGHRGYFAIREDLNFVYYASQDPLTDIYNTTAAEFVTGTPKILLTLRGGYASKIAPYNGESDQPVQQETTAGSANIEWALRRRTDLRFFYGAAKLDFSPVEDLREELPPPPDNTSWEAGAAVEQELGRLLEALVQGSVGNVEIDDPTVQTSSDFWRVLGGVSLEGEKLGGRIAAGYGETDSTTPGDDAFKDFIIDTNVTYEAGRRLSLNVFLTRARRISALIGDNFQLNTEFGARGTFPIAGRFFLDGGVTIGSNDYGDALIGVGGTPVNNDDYRTYDAGLNFEFTEHIRVRGNFGYQQRDSNDPLLNKDRFTVGAGIIVE